MFAQTLGAGMMSGFPSVNLTPMPPLGQPTPVPYEQMGETILLVAPTAAINVLQDCMPTVTIATLGTITEGDFAGVMLGVMSGLMMGPAIQILGSETILVDGVPGQRLTGTCSLNATNMPMSIHIAPGQPTVLFLG